MTAQLPTTCPACGGRLRMWVADECAFDADGLLDWSEHISVSIECSECDAKPDPDTRCAARSALLAVRKNYEASR